MAFQDYGVMQAQVDLILRMFTEKEKAGGSTEDSFLKLDSVKGSATDSSFKDQIPVYFAQNFVMQTGGGVNTAAGKATPSDYFLVIPVDLSSPPLELGAATASPFNEAVITYRRSEKGEQKPYHVDTLKDVKVSLFYMTHTGVSTHPHVAIIALQYASINMAQGSTKAGYSYAQNKKE